MRMGRSLRDKAPQSDHDVLHDAVVQLKTKWTSLCSRAVDRFVSFGLPLRLPVYFYVFFFISILVYIVLFLALWYFSAHLCG